MYITRALSILTAAALGLLAVVAPAHAAAPPPPPPGDIAGYTVSPSSGVVTQAAVTVTVPRAVTSTDCNTPGQFEYAEFGLRFGANTFARVAATCGNTGNLAYFCDLESGGVLKIVLLKPGQTVTLRMALAGATTTISMTRNGSTRQVSGSAGTFSSVGVGGWYEPGFDIPVLTTNPGFTAPTVNNASPLSQPAVRTSLSDGTNIIMRPTAPAADGSFVVRYLRQA